MYALYVSPVRPLEEATFWINHYKVNSNNGHAFMGKVYVDYFYTSTSTFYTSIKILTGNFEWIFLVIQILGAQLNTIYHI